MTRACIYCLAKESAAINNHLYFVKTASCTEPHLLDLLKQINFEPVNKYFPT